MQERVRALSIYREKITDDEWSKYKDPLSEEELAELKTLTRQLLDMQGAYAPSEHTCDDCADRFVCHLVFDSYNTQGDCLMEK